MVEFSSTLLITALVYTVSDSIVKFCCVLVLKILLKVCVLKIETPAAKVAL